MRSKWKLCTGGAIVWQSHVPTPDQAASLELGQNGSWIQTVGGPDPTRWQAIDNPWDNGIETDDAGRPLNPEQPRPGEASAAKTGTHGGIC